MTDDDDQPKRWTDRRELETTATPQQVWEAWAKPEIIAGWFADRAYGTPEKGSTITHVFEAFGLELPYQVVEAIPGETIVFDGIGPGGRPFRQEIHIHKRGGRTVLELVHSGFDAEASWDDEFEGIDSGWQLALAVLRHYLETYFGRAKKTWLTMRPAPLDLGRANDLFRSREGLAAWLTDGNGEVGEVGDAVALSLRDGRHLGGLVLAWSGREVALSWPEIDGVLELKAFTSPAGTMVGLRAFSWADTPPDDDAMNSWMNASLDALVGHLAK